MTRFLQSTLRTVGQDVDGYLAAWATLREQAATLGLRAWMFRALDDVSCYIEFLESKQAINQQLQLDAALLTKLHDLDRFGTGSTRHWVEP